MDDARAFQTPAPSIPERKGLGGRMRYGSLFFGIGGFDLAFERAGMECAWQCEIDEHAQSVLRKHFKAEVHNDVRKVGKDTGAVDLICGGFPCQDLSIAGKRTGLTGERSGLWFEFARVIDELEPGWVVIENVPGLLSSNKGQDFAIILRWLVERGYGVSWRILDAQYFGVPQRRRRVFIVASLGSGRSAKVLFESEGGAGDIEKGGKEREAVARTFTIRAGKDGGGKGYLEQASLTMALGGQNQYLELASGNKASPTIMANYGTKWGLGDQEAFSGDYHVFVNTANSGANQNNAKVSKIMDTLDTLASVAELQPTVWSPRSQDGTHRIHESGVVPALNTAQGGQRQPMVGVRRLTPLECERLQGFPDGWTEGQADTQRYKQLGNAVAVPVVEWIGRRIATIENDNG